MLGGVLSVTAFSGVDAVVEYLVEAPEVPADSETPLSLEVEDTLLPGSIGLGALYGVAPDYPLAHVVPKRAPCEAMPTPPPEV